MKLIKRIYINVRPISVLYMSRAAKDIKPKVHFPKIVLILKKNLLKKRQTHREHTQFTKHKKATQKHITQHNPSNSLTLTGLLSLRLFHYLVACFKFKNITNFSHNKEVSYSHNQLATPFRNHKFTRIEQAFQDNLNLKKYLLMLRYEFM